MNRFIIFLFLSICLYTSGMAQPISRATAKVNLGVAEDQTEKQDYYRALEYYDLYFEETKDYDVYPEMARLAMKLRDYKKAERFYKGYLGSADDDDEVEVKKKEEDEELNTFQYGLKKAREAVGKGKAAVKKKKGKGKKKKNKKKSKKAKDRAKAKAKKEKEEERNAKAAEKGIMKKKRERKPLTPEQKEDRYDYGRVLKANEKYELAIAQLEKYVKEGTDEVKIALAKSEIEGAQFALQTGVTLEDGESVNGIQVTPIKKLNSKEREYGPFLHKGELYYAAFGDVKEIISTDGETPMAYAQIYKSTKNGEDWSKGEPLDTKINREDYQTAYPHISPDGETMYFTRSLLRGNKAEISKIYYSKSKGSEWAGPNEVVIGFDDLEFQAFHPCVGDLFGKEVLFFVSDMDGGEGGRDIYYATKKGEGVYGEPVNLASVNTPGDEETPFYRNGALYFSSNGLPGFGGYDIFTTVWNGERWSQPENMGVGYNTPLDEMSFYLDANGETGLLTSNRAGRGFVSKTSCFDIFSIVIPPIQANILAEVFEGKKKLRGVTVSLVEMQGDQPVNPKDQSNKKANTFDFPLGLEKTYMLIASKKGYTKDTITVATLDLKENKTYTGRFNLEKAKPKPSTDGNGDDPNGGGPGGIGPNGEKLDENGNPIPEFEEIVVEINQPIRLNNIFYEFDDDKILTESEQDLSVLLDLMQRYPDMVIELSSHTDYRGNNDYNENLSQRRANSAKKWLTEKGIDPLRIKAVGYGEKLPATVDAETSTENPFLTEGWVLDFNLVSKITPKANREVAHQFNRRTEFRIIAGPTNIKIQKMEKRLKKVAPPPSPKKKTNKKKTTKKKKSRKRNANPISDILPNTGPKMVFEYSEIDFGPVKKGEKREHIFEFTNEGDEPLIIELVSSCDCTTTEYSTEPVKPGEKGTIKATFDSSTMTKSEKMDIDIILANENPETGYQVVERVSFMFELVAE